jgi:parallel beta-helix repeat protein
MFVVSVNVRFVGANGTIYIRADGSIDPSDSPISTVDNVTYTMTGNITSGSHGIVVLRSNIIIDGAGYTLQGPRVYEFKGIYLDGRSNVTIKNMEIKTFIYGVWLHFSSNNSISGNTFTNDGLYVWGSYQNSVENNTVNGRPLVYLEGASNYTVDDAGQVILVRCDNTRVEGLNLSSTTIGIELWETSNNSISGNNITANNGGGIELYSSSNNSISGNNITNNLIGIQLYGSHNNLINNTLTNNGISLGGSYNSAIGNTITNGRVYLEGDTTYNSVIGNTITGFGVYLAERTGEESTYNSVIGNTITGGGIRQGLYGTPTYNLNISGNTITNCGRGIDFFNVYNFTISGNTITNNTYGMFFWVSAWHSIVGNTIENNDYGIWLGETAEISIYHNNFRNNIQQVHLSDIYLPSLWDDGYPSGGNYWSDHTGIDLYSGPYQNITGSDGIGDTPYIIDGEQDRYPRMNSIHDIAVTDIALSKTFVAQGYNPSINVTVTNQGIFTETFMVTLYADSGQIINETGLVGYWSFDEGSGTTASDSSGNRNDGTIYGAAWTDGKFGKALSFDGTDDYALVPASASLNISDAVTIAAWMKLENVPIEAYEFIDSAGYGYAAYVYVSDPLGVRFNFVRVSGGVGGDLQADFWKQYGAELPFLPYNQWYYVVWVYDSSGYTAIYVNGNPYANTTLMSGKIDDYGGGVFINCRNLHKGILDELRIYNRTLNQQEIRAVAARARAIARLPHALSLASGDSITFTFIWNTSGFARGNYTMSAYAWPVPGEVDTEDNNFTDGSILITKVGDLGGGVPPAFFSCDESVDGKDLALFLQCYKGTAPAEAMYLGDLGGGVPPQFYDCDGNVDGKDLSLFLQCYKGLGP